MGKTFKLSEYVKEASVAPFPLEISDEETLLIPPPDGDTMLAIEETQSSRVTIELLCTSTLTASSNYSARPQRA